MASLSYNCFILTWISGFWTLCGRSLLKEKWLCENTVISILDCVDCFSYKLTIASKIEEANLKQNQVKLKQLYDKYAMKRKSLVSTVNLYSFE
jgi:ABC-type uncharacterized transport system permease subunit